MIGEVLHIGGWRAVDLDFRSIAVWSISGRLATSFADAWPAYRRWYLREGDAARPSYRECRGAIARYMPEILDTYDDIVDVSGGGDLEARLLSHWNPPTLFGACSMAAYTAGPVALVRNYDYPAAMCDTAVLASAWTGPAIIAMADCVWGVLDGMNEHGLAIAISFGGRHVAGEGFGIGLIVRYALETCRDVEAAVDVFRRIPVSMAYNVMMVDRGGRHAMVMISPDRKPVVTDARTAANRQGETEWPTHAVFCATVEREEELLRAVDDPELDLEALTQLFLSPPLHRSFDITPWGTVFTTAYDTSALTLDLLWPDDSWHLSLDTFAEETRPRRVTVPIPVPRPVPAFELELPTVGSFLGY